MLSPTWFFRQPVVDLGPVCLPVGFADHAACSCRYLALVSRDALVHVQVEMLLRFGPQFKRWDHGRVYSTSKCVSVHTPNPACSCLNDVPQYGVLSLRKELLLLSQLAVSVPRHPDRKLRRLEVLHQLAAYHVLPLRDVRQFLNVLLESQWAYQCKINRPNRCKCCSLRKYRCETCIVT